MTELAIGLMVAGLAGASLAIVKLSRSNPEDRIPTATNEWFASFCVSYSLSVGAVVVGAVLSPTGPPTAMLLGIVLVAILTMSVRRHNRRVSD